MPWDDGLDWYPTGGDGGDILSGIEDDPYANWGGGAGGDGSNGSEDWLQNILQGAGGGSSGGGVNLGSASGLLSLLQNGGGASGSSSGGLTDILKALGLTTGSDMGALLPLLSLLAGGAGLMNQNSNTEDAAKQLQAGADKANAQATDLIGGARGAFTPYQQAGESAVGQLSGMVGANNMAGKFGPITGNGDLASKFKGTMTLKQLMGK